MIVVHENHSGIQNLPSLETSTVKLSLLIHLVNCRESPVISTRKLIDFRNAYALMKQRSVFHKD